MENVHAYLQGSEEMKQILLLLMFFVGWHFAAVNVSAYTATDDECGKADGITASGTMATEGRTIAADDLPFGTQVEINGQIYTVEDRFGGGYEDRIDIFMTDQDRAWNFGRRLMIVRIMKARVKNETNT